MTWDPPSSRPVLPTDLSPRVPPPPPPDWYQAMPPVPGPRSSGGGGRWTLLGSVVSGGAVLVAVVLAATSTGARAQAISSFARAASGCRTVIDVADAGTYLVVSEVRGALSAVDGSCPAPVGPFDLGGSTAPAVDVVVRSATGSVVEQGPARSGSYDTGTYAGAVTATVELTPGRYEVEVSRSDYEGAIRAERRTVQGFTPSVGSGLRVQGGKDGAGADISRRRGRRARGAQPQR